jgi:hypothetical protein
VTSYSALAPVSAAVFAALNVAALTAIAPGGVTDDVPQGAAFPVVLYEVSERPHGGFGTKPGVVGQLPEVELTVHVYSQYGGMVEAQTVMAKVIELLASPPAVTGYASWAIFHDETIPVGDELLAGVKVKELVAKFRLYVEAQ